jgi:hypothetical protein
VVVEIALTWAQSLPTWQALVRRRRGMAGSLSALYGNRLVLLELSLDR